MWRCNNNYTNNYNTKGILFFFTRQGAYIKNPFSKCVNNLELLRIITLTHQYPAPAFHIMPCIFIYVYGHLYGIEVLGSMRALHTFRSSSVNKETTCSDRNCKTFFFTFTSSHCSILLHFWGEYQHIDNGKQKTESVYCSQCS